MILSTNSVRLACQRRRDTAEEYPRDQQADPDDKAKQADEINRGELAEALLPQRLEVRKHADREESKNKEDDTEGIGLADRRRHVFRDIRRRAEREVEADDERHQKADDELRKPLPDF